MAALLPRSYPHPLPSHTLLKTNNEANTPYTTVTCQQLAETLGLFSSPLLPQQEQSKTHRMVEIHPNHLSLNTHYQVFNTSLVQPNTLHNIFICCSSSCCSYCCCCCECLAAAYGPTAPQVLTTNPLLPHNRPCSCAGFFSPGYVLC